MKAARAARLASRGCGRTGAPFPLCPPDSTTELLRLAFLFRSCRSAEAFSHRAAPSHFARRARRPAEMVRQTAATRHTTRLPTFLCGARHRDRIYDAAESELDTALPDRILHRSAHAAFSIPHDLTAHGLLPSPHDGAPEVFAPEALIPEYRYASRTCRRTSRTCVWTHRLESARVLDSPLRAV